MPRTLAMAQASYGDRVAKLRSRHAGPAPTRVFIAASRVHRLERFTVLFTVVLARASIPFKSPKARSGRRVGFITVVRVGMRMAPYMLYKWKE